MAGQYDVKNTKEILRLGLAGFQAYQMAMEDGKINLSDLAHLMLVVPYLEAAVKDIALIPKELGELDEADGKDLLAFAAGILPGLVEVKLAMIINAVLKGVVGLLEAYALIKNEKVNVVFPVPVIKP
ncbi:MAG: hypothetical protein ACXAC2_02580 [Candidatus Kariarchaeaceae archaeon]|jgi:hypothetical protein